MTAGRTATDTAQTCPYCGQPFPTRRILRLHEGREHFTELSTEKQHAVRAAADEEATQLRRFQLKAILGLIFLYFGFLFTYAAFA